MGKKRRHMFDIRLSPVLNCRGIKLRPLCINLIGAHEQDTETETLERQKSSLHVLHRHKVRGKQKPLG